MIFANERVRPEFVANAPSMDAVRIAKPTRILTIEALVRMKLTSFRNKDRMHLRDLIKVGLVDDAWLSELIPELASRLKMVLDTPDG